MTAMSSMTPATARADGDYWGRLVESAVGAHLVNTADRGLEVTWWRDRDREVDSVLSRPGETLAIEVTSGRRKRGLPGLEAFGRAFGPSRKLLIGGQGLPLEAVLSEPAGALMG